MSSSFRTLDDAAVAGKRVLLRVDLNVPMELGRVTDLTRIERVLPTIREISHKGGKAILLAHFGRPKGGPDEANCLRSVAAAVADLLKQPVAFASDCRGEAAAGAIAAMKDGDVLVLENTRFHKGEEKNDPAFVAELAKLGDLYVNDAFSAAHRAHASTEGLAHLLPAYAGRAMQAELEALAKALEAPKRPLVAIVGGAKVSTKLDLLGNLVAKVDALVIMAKAIKTRCAIILPVDAIVAFHFAAHAPAHDYGVDAIPADGMMLDIGQLSIDRVKASISEAATVVWNGPVGAFELAGFEHGTMALARHVAERTKAHKLVSVAGGGDTVAALNAAGVAGDFTYVSTAGGAFLEWMEGKALPGVEALRS
jgi:phosphoglycerate kinase